MSKKLSYKILAAVLALNVYNLTAAAPAWATEYKYLHGDETNKQATVGDGGNYDYVVGTGKVEGTEDKPWEVKYLTEDDVSNAQVTVNNGTVNYYIYGGATSKGNATYNNVLINSGTYTEYDGGLGVYGGYTENGNAEYNKIEVNDLSYNGGYFCGGAAENGNAVNNTVILNSYNDSYAQVCGGNVEDGQGNATGNTVIINDSNLGEGGHVYGGMVVGTGNAENNTVVLLKNSTVYAVYGGIITYNSGDVKNNTVEIDGGTVTDYVFAGDASNDASTIADNQIILTNNADVSGAELYGGYSSNGSSPTIQDNSLVLNGWSGSAEAAKSFGTISFENTKWENGATVLTLTNASQNDLANTQIDIVSFDKNTEIKPGESMTFVSGNGTELGIQQINVRKTALQGLAKEITGIMESTNGIEYTFTIEKIGVNPQTNLLTQTNAASAAFVNQGTDLINDSLDVIGRDGTYGVKTFAAVQGNRSKYDVADDLKINGWSVIAGFGAENEHNGGDFAWGVFYENGSGNYRTYNHFNNEFFRGDGSMVYNGGGVAARYENSHGVYTEGSLRAGMLKNEMDNALRDANGSYGCDTESAYYGAHIGVGQIFELSESSDLDVYGKFFHTYTEGDNVTIAGDKFDFDSITSDRLRVGARVITNKANAFSAYYGLAYEYEFNGDADMTAQGIKAPTESFGGSSCMAELGLNYQPTPDSPWNFDLNLRGYAGERKGGSFNLQATYTF